LKKSSNRRNPPERAGAIVSDPPLEVTRRSSLAALGLGMAGLASGSMASTVLRGSAQTGELNVAPALSGQSNWLSLQNFAPAGEPAGAGNVDWDTNAFRRALDQIGTGRRAVDIAGGLTYPFTSIFVPPGDFRVRGGFGAGLFALGLWCVPGSVTITIQDSSYLFEIPNRLDFTYLSGFRFIGGKGVLRHSYTGNNVAHDHVIERCSFYDYTECAISSDAGDMPYWRIRNSFFYCKPASGTLCKGVAIGGLLDNSVIEQNAFLRNDIHLQLGPMNAGNLHVLNNDFLSFEPNRTDYDVWLVPNDRPGGFGTNSGQATRFVGNKFGNENITDPAKKAPRMLVAPARGANRATCTPELGWQDGTDGRHWLSGLSFSTNRVSSTSIDGRGGVDASFMDIHIANMGQTFWAPDNVVGDGYLNYLFRFVDRGARVADRSNTNWQVQLGAGLRGPEGALLRDGVSNGPVGPIEDPFGLVQGPLTLLAAGVVDPEARTIAEANSPADWTIEADVAKEAGPALVGRPTTLASIRRAGSLIVLPLPDLGPYVDRMAWLVGEFRAVGAVAPDFLVRIENAVDFRTQLRDTFPLRAEWQAISVPFFIPRHPQLAAFQLRLTSLQARADANQFLLGRWVVAVGRSPPRLS
jgi:hypothetical protein